MPKSRTEVKHGSKIEPERNSWPVRIAPGIAVESPIRLYVEEWEGDYDLELDVIAEPATDERAGRFVCQRLTVRQRQGGQPVTSEAIRRVPVATLIRGVGAQHWMTIEDEGEQGVSMSDRRLDDHSIERIKREGPTDEAMAWVAHAYRMALVLGDPPTRAVEAALELPRSTAGRWVAMAREKGFLGRTEGQGKAGG